MRSFAEKAFESEKHRNAMCYFLSSDWMIVPARRVGSSAIENEDTLFPMFWGVRTVDQILHQREGDHLPRSIFWWKSRTSTRSAIYFWPFLRPVLGKSNKKTADGESLFLIHGEKKYAEFFKSEKRETRRGIRQNDAFSAKFIRILLLWIFFSSADE